MTDELFEISQRYARRGARQSDPCALIKPETVLVQQEKERRYAQWLRSLGRPPSELRLLEVGCGAGGNLLGFLRLGMAPQNLVGNELLPERLEAARQLLPAGLQLHAGDASALELPAASFDVVFQSTVFTSILDRSFQQKLADRMWSLVRPGGGVLWYDFVYDNPRNPDVKGVPVSRIRELFPGAFGFFERVTLAPPIARRVTRLNPRLYALFNALPALRTHVICYVMKPER